MTAPRVATFSLFRLASLRSSERKPPSKGRVILSPCLVKCAQKKFRSSTAGNCGRGPKHNLLALWGAGKRPLRSSSLL